MGRIMEYVGLTFATIGISLMAIMLFLFFAMSPVVVLGALVYFIIWTLRSFGII